MVLNVTKQELYLFGLLIIFASIWIILVIPDLVNSTAFNNLNPVGQYIVFNIGFVLLTIVLINIPYKLITHHKVNLTDTLKIGIAGWLLFSFVLDLWQPPNYISTEGQILITAKQSLPNTADDAMLTFVWSHVIPSNVFIKGVSLLYIAVYFFTPIITVLVMILLFKPSVVKKVLLDR